MRLLDPSVALRLLLLGPALWLLALGAARAEDIDPADPAPADEPRVFDPLQGIDQDGRIPGILRPADLPNPERWRYIPEGRLKPGNVFQRFLVSSMIAPFVFYDGDVGVGFGVALIDIDFREQRRREFAGAFLSYTTEGQQNYTFVWRRWIHHLELPGGGVLQEERSLLRAAGGYERSLTRRFFGIGPKTPESDETSYRDTVGFLELGIDLAIPDPGDDLVLSLGASGEWHDLGSGHVEGEPNTGDVYPDLFGPADPAALGFLTPGCAGIPATAGQPYGGGWVGGTSTPRPARTATSALFGPSRGGASSRCPGSFTPAAIRARSTLPPTRWPSV